MGGSKLKNIVGVRFKKLGKIYFFNPRNLKVVKGDKVIVETAQGEEPFGQQIGDSTPYDEIVDTMTESILASFYGNKKKV